MGHLRFVVSLTNKDNDYQIEQAAAAQEAATRLRVHVEILYANNDAIEQSQQLLRIIQSSSTGTRPDGIVVEPVGTPLASAARAAATAGIGWALLNREADYISELRQSGKAPVFRISSDHKEIGRIQGRQFRALLPKGGSVLYIQGPLGDAADGRTAGMLETKPANITTRMLRGNWTEASAQKAISSWLALSTSRDEQIDVVGAQNDSMGMAARQTFEAQSKEEREKRRNILFTGCDGLPKTGQEWVRRGLLKATVVVPPNTGTALEILVNAIQHGATPPETAFTKVTSFPTLEALTAQK
jgi:ribose transport system substrate-binding protein